MNYTAVGTVRREKKGKLVQQNSGKDRGTIQWMSVHWLYKKKIVCTVRE